MWDNIRCFFGLHPKKWVNKSLCLDEILEPHRRVLQECYVCYCTNCNHGWQENLK